MAQGITPSYKPNILDAPTIHIVLKKNKVNHPIADQASENIFYFRTKIFPLLLREECGKCEKLCHKDKNDTGGVTCGGVSIKHNPKWFVTSLNKFHSSCRYTSRGKHGKPLLICDNTKDIRTAVFELYLNKYAKPFLGCSKKALPMLVDSSVLDGRRTAIKLLQQAGRVKVDYSIGKNTLKTCQDNFNAKRFTELRIKRFKTLKTCKYHCKGWIRRAKRKLHEYNFKT